MLHSYAVSASASGIKFKLKFKTADSVLGCLLNYYIYSHCVFELVSKANDLQKASP